MYLLIVCHFDQECLVEPLGVLYGGGIKVNSEFNHNIEGWRVLFGQGKSKNEYQRKETGSLWLTVGRILQTVSPERSS